MANNEHTVFISYAWGEETSEREAIVNQIDQSLQKRGLKIIRDKRNLGYKGSISKFMDRIGEGDSIIVVISDKYLRSKNCMYELVEIAKHKQFVDRVFPIILSDAKIYDAGDRVDYVEHWEKEKERLNEKIRELSDFSNLQSIQEELNNYDEFRDQIDGLAGLLKDMNTLSPNMHKDSDFSELFTAIEKRMKELGSKLAPVMQNDKQASTAPTEQKPIPVGMLAGAGAILLVIAIIAFSALGKRGSNASPTAESTQPSAIEEPTNAVATQGAPTQAATEVTVTEALISTATAAEAAPPSYFTETFSGGIDPTLWDSFFVGDGNPKKASVVPSSNGNQFSLNDSNLYAYHIYKPVTYKDVVIRIRAADVGQVKGAVRLVCRRTGNSWYEFAVTGGGLWNLYYYNNGTYNPVRSAATTALKGGQNINLYEMSCIGNEISLSVNGEAIRTLNDTNLAEGQVGFSVSSLNFFPVAIEVKNFEVAEPPPP